MNSVLIKFNSGHARKSCLKKTISVASRDPSGFLNPGEEQSYRHSGRVVKSSKYPSKFYTIVTIRKVLPSIILLVITIRVVGLFSTSEKNCCFVSFWRFFCICENKNCHVSLQSTFYNFTCRLKPTSPVSISSSNKQPILPLICSNETLTDW